MNSKYVSCSWLIPLTLDLCLAQLFWNKNISTTDDQPSLNYPVPCKVELNSQYSDAIIERISHWKHLKTVLLVRFIKFSNTLMNAENIVLRFIAVLNKNEIGQYLGRISNH